MDQKSTNTQLSEEQQKAEHHGFIKESANDGSYFKDAHDWYFFRYVSPLCDRTLMIFVAIVGAISLFFLIQIIDGLFPLVQKVPIAIAAKDQSIYTPFVKSLRNAKDDSTVDTSIAKYLLSVYINDRESYDYRDSNVESVNKKFRRIRNTSSFNEYKNFQFFMGKDNPDSPLNDFGREAYRTVEVKSVTLLKNQNENYYSLLRNFFLSAEPSEAEVRFVVTTHRTNDEEVENVEKINYLAKVKFTFGGVDRRAKTGILNFSITSYKLYKIK